MRLLAVETATLTGGVALLDGERLVGESTLSVALTHSERLMAVVDRLLADCGWRAADLQGLAVSVGPGSFTGLRVGVATVKGLALGLGLPVAAVPTLDALAETLPWAALPVSPLLDARKGEVYLSLYRWTGERMARQWEYLALPPAEAAARLPRPVIVLGDGVPPCREALAAAGPGVHEAPPARRLPSAAVVGQLGLARLRAGETVEPDALTPLYLRPSEAQLRAAIGTARG
jgi:tRNA threonylcarbamoyladenosine biosynthesis protein TsaB